MTTSQQPNREDRRKAAKADKASTAADFKKKKSDVIRLPSGNRVKMRRPGMMKFLESGFLPDPLADLVRKEISQRTGKVTEADMLKALASGQDMELIKEMIRATDRITAFCVYEPEVRWHERELPGLGPNGAVQYEDIPDEERDDSVVYTDEMEDEDKRFIFQLAVGGSADLAQFRQATSALVGDLSAS